MSSPESVPQRGRISRPHELPSVKAEAQPVHKRPTAPSFPRLPIASDVQRPRVAGQLQPRTGERPTQPQIDPNQFIIGLVNGGLLPPEQGLDILGKSEAERHQFVEQMQEQQRQAVEALKKEGTYDMYQRIAEIDATITSKVIPIENAGQIYTSGILSKWDDPEQKHPLQEWRSPDELKPMTFKERLKNVATSPLSLFKETYPLADVIVVDNPDGTQTRYIDRATVLRHQIIGNGVPKADVYKETYSKEVNKITGERKLLSRERVGENIMITGWDDSEGEDKLKPYFGIATKEYYAMVEEKFKLQSDIMAKKEEAFLKTINC